MKSRETLVRLHRFQVDEKRRQVADIEAMIADFQRMERELEQQIVAEQERSGITDVTHYAYPTFAKAANDRRANLLRSVEELEGQLAEAREQFAEAYSELKKHELMQEKDQDRKRTELLASEQSDLDAVAAEMHRRSSMTS
jgi:flagellar export protein FliJ